MEWTNDPKYLRKSTFQNLVNERTKSLTIKRTEQFKSEWIKLLDKIEIKLLKIAICLQGSEIKVFTIDKKMCFKGKRGQGLGKITNSKLIY